jgi:TolB-like protein
MNSRNFFTELKRRNVYKAAVAYAVVGWLLIQIATQTFPFLDIPNWAVKLVILLVAIGFPVALIIAWAFELTPQGIKRTEAADGMGKQRKRRTWIAVALTGVILSISLFFVGRYISSIARTSASEPWQKSIAVLPFENFSDDKENAFFADGIQDDILTSLAKIRDLRVISRTSTEAYRDPKNSRNLREIGKALGAANILEGSVRKAGDRVVITVQLIEALHDRHLWANRYDRTIADSIGLQGELAGEIASALHAVLSPEEKARVETKPTDNADAYVFYLRGRQIAQNPDTLLEDYKTAQQLFEQAVALDPKFALAHARLASTCGAIFHFFEPLESWKTKATAEAEIALKLQPSVAEAYLAHGQCLYWFEQNYERALQEFNIALALSPSNAEVGTYIASIKRRQGHWQESLDAFEQAQKIDPQDPNIIRNVLFTNTAMRRWPDASRAAERFRAMAPASLVAKVQSVATSIFGGKGRLLLSSRC